MIIQLRNDLALAKARRVAKPQVANPRDPGLVYWHAGDTLGARTRMDRRVAALRCVEAVRLYAAAHDGKLPPSLDEIKDVPVPRDPVDDKPFGYRLVGV